MTLYLAGWPRAYAQPARPVDRVSLILTLDPHALRKARESVGLSRERLARALTISAKTVYNWERSGRISTRNHLALAKLARIEGPSGRPRKPYRISRQQNWTPWPGTYIIRLLRPGHEDDLSALDGLPSEHHYLVALAHGKELVGRRYGPDHKPTTSWLTGRTTSDMVDGEPSIEAMVAFDNLMTRLTEGD